MVARLNGGSKGLGIQEISVCYDGRVEVRIERFENYRVVDQVNRDAAYGQQLLSVSIYPCERKVRSRDVPTTSQFDVLRYSHRCF